MSIKFHCDRCGAVGDPKPPELNQSGSFTVTAGGSTSVTSPAGWRNATIKAPHKNGSPTVVMLCLRCDDLLTDWFNLAGRYEEPSAG